MFGLSTLHLKRLVNQAFSQPSFLLSDVIFKHFFCFSFISWTFGNKQKAFLTASSKEHDCVKVVLFQTNMPEQHVINWPIEMQRSCSERRNSQNNGLVTSALFFSSPRLALRAKCRVRLAWLIKRLLCRLLSLHNMPYYMAESVFAMRLVNLWSVTCYTDQNF